jgi:hypothetical protein
MNLWSDKVYVHHSFWDAARIHFNGPELDDWKDCVWFSKQESERDMGDRRGKTPASEICK